MARSSKTGVRGLYKRKDGRYCIDLRYVDAATGERKRYMEDLPPGLSAAAAKERARVALNAAIGGTLRRKDRAPKRLHAALEDYIEWSRANRPRTLTDRRHLAEVLKRHLGNPLLSALSPFGVERFKRDRAAEGVGPATVNRALAMLKHLLGLAADWGWITQAAAQSIRSVPLLKEPPGRVRYLTNDEAADILGALREDVRPVALVAMMTGMRLGEILRLRKSSVDLNAKLITLTETKTNRVRHVPLSHEALIAVISAAIDRSPSKFVFTSRKGRPLTHRATTLFRDTVRALGIENLRFHDLRHDFATKLRRHGVGLDEIADLLGHTSLAMTRRYAHISPDALRRAVAKLNLPPVPPPCEAPAPSEPTGVLIPFPLHP